MGFLRSADTQETAVRENIQKARHTIYSLMGSGLHGHNGLDQETLMQLLNMYILLVLVYGLEVVLPKATLIKKLERIHKQFIKHILSIPTPVADPAGYILTSTIPIEGMIHKRVLTLFGNISRLGEDSVEKQLACQQYSVKGCESNSWFVAVRRLLVKYNLLYFWEVLNNPAGSQWLPSR